MTQLALILKILLSLSPHVSDLSEPPEVRTARLTEVAVAIDEAARNANEIAALITLGSFESHFAGWVGAGCLGKPPPRTGTCDHRRSRGYWQIKRSGCSAGWALPLGSAEADKAFAVCAIGLFRGAYFRCHDGLRGAFSGYWRSCSGLPDVDKRVELHGKIMWMLRGKGR